MEKRRKRGAENGKADGIRALGVEDFWISATRMMDKERMRNPL